MKLLKITGPMGSGKTVQLNAVLDASGAGGIRLSAVMADGDLARRVQQAVVKDEFTTVCIDDCTETQVRMLEVMCKDPAWPDAEIHVVVQA
jgi:Ni2+-binding GTPase involved in maturation of urease and hydrogenase